MSFLLRFCCGRPQVIVDFLFRDGLLFVVLKNIGRQPAYDITVKFDKPLRGVNGTRVISDLALFRDTAFLPPRKEISAFVDSSAAYFSLREPTEIFTSITFHNARWRRYDHTIRHNLEIYRDIGYLRAPQISQKGGRGKLP